MWNHIRQDYTPSNHPSHIACQPPLSNLPAPAILAAAAFGDRLIASTIFRLATGHCFDADYSDRFRAGADDITLCPCSRTQPRLYRHTRAHRLFRCREIRAIHMKHLGGVSTSLRHILQSAEMTSRLCALLKESNSSLLRPLTEDRRDPRPRSAPDPSPDPPW
jgi:hypothetical protein